MLGYDVILWVDILAPAIPCVLKGQTICSQEKTYVDTAVHLFEKIITHISIGTPSKPPVESISTSESKSMGAESAQDCKAARDQSCHPWLSGLVDWMASTPSFSNEVPGESISIFTFGLSEDPGAWAVSRDSSASASLNSWAVWQSPECYVVQLCIWKSTISQLWYSWSWTYWSSRWEEWPKTNLTDRR